MEVSTNPSGINYQQVTVDVPEDRVAEFHAFFARFLAGRSGRTRRGRHGRLHHAGHGHRCEARRETAEQAPEATGTTEL